MNNIEIARDRKKLVQIFVVLVLFIVVGAPGFVFSFDFDSRWWGEVVGTVCLVLLALGIGLLFIYIAEARKKGPGLLINSEGITETASVENVGFIPWSDIVGFKDAHEFNQKYLGVIVKNPNDYLNRQSAFKRRVMWKNYQIKGVVISIPQNRLEISYEELKTLLEQKLKAYKK